VYLGDLTNRENVAQVMRAVAMLEPRAPALNREEACAVLEALITALIEAKRPHP
jgi:hypothetical protein